MTFFNKKTEVMQIEMTPYGRYLYSIGKFKPHSYEFVDDDVVYKISGSTEVQEAAHKRIISETPKLKINRAFQDEAPQVLAPSRIEDKRVMVKKNNQRQADLFAMGKSSYSSDNTPSFQVSMLRGEITGSRMTYDIVSSSYGASGSLFIPQIEIDFNIQATLKNELSSIKGEISSETFDNGDFVDITYQDKIIHLKEFNSFYEKENFEIEVFLSQSTGELRPMKFTKNFSIIVNDILLDEEDYLDRFPETNSFFEEGREDPNFIEYFFDIEIDSEIPQEDLCKAVEKLEINNQFLDEELICPDQRTDRFDIYSTRVSPEDLEDCD
jgi:hypothetical protein